MSPPSDLVVERGAGHDTEGRQLADGWHVYPEMAAAGLWATPTDLARFFLALIRSRNEQPSPVVESIARLLTEPVLTQLSSSRDVALDLFSEEPGSNERAVGLGTFFERRNAKWTFGHPGCNHGYRALARASLDDGFGHVIMVNSDNGDALIDELDSALMSCH